MGIHPPPKLVVNAATMSWAESNVTEPVHQDNAGSDIPERKWERPRKRCPGANKADR